MAVKFMIKHKSINHTQKIEKSEILSENNEELNSNLN